MSKQLKSSLVANTGMRIPNSYQSENRSTYEKEKFISNKFKTRDSIPKESENSTLLTPPGSDSIRG